MRGGEPPVPLGRVRREQWRERVERGERCGGEFQQKRSSRPLGHLLQCAARVCARARACTLVGECGIPTSAASAMAGNSTVSASAGAPAADVASTLRPTWRPGPACDAQRSSRARRPGRWLATLRRAEASRRTGSGCALPPRPNRRVPSLTANKQTNKALLLEYSAGWALKPHRPPARARRRPPPSWRTSGACARARPASRCNRRFCCNASSDFTASCN